MADRAASGVDLLTASDHGGVRPDAQRHVDVGVLERCGHVSVPALFLVLVAIRPGGRRADEPETNEQSEHADRQRCEEFGSHVGLSSEVPVDADEELIAPVPQRTALDEAPEVHAVADEEGDVLPGIELRLHGQHGTVALLVLEAAGPELVEAARQHDLLVDEIVGLNRETGGGAVEAPTKLAGQAVEPIPDHRAVDVELLPSDVGRDAVSQSVEAIATWLVVVLWIGRSDDPEPPVHEGGDVEGKLPTVEEVEAYSPVGVESLVLPEEADLAENDVVEHRVKVGARGARRVVHDLIGNELRLALIAILEEPEELRGEHIRDNRQALDRAVSDLELGRRDELAVGRVGEVRVRVDLAGHQHRPVHRKTAVCADHRLTAHFHGRGAERTKEAPEVEHEERLLAETELAPGEVAPVLERDRVRLAFDLHKDAQLGQKRSRDEQGDLVRWSEFRLGLSRRCRVLEEPALDSKGKAVD